MLPYVESVDLSRERVEEEVSIHLRFDEHDVDCEDDIVKLDVLVCKLFAVWLCILVSVLLGNLLLTVLTHCVRRKLSLEYSVKSVWTVAEHSTHRGIIVFVPVLLLPLESKDEGSKSKCCKEHVSIDRFEDEAKCVSLFAADNCG